MIAAHCFPKCNLPTHSCQTSLLQAHSTAWVFMMIKDRERWLHVSLSLWCRTTEHWDRAICTHTHTCTTWKQATQAGVLAKHLAGSFVYYSHGELLSIV